MTFAAIPPPPAFAAGLGPLPADMTAQVTNPLSWQSSLAVFRAQAAVQQNFTLTGGAETDVIHYDTVLEDPYGGWNAGSNRWTVPFTGWYQVTVFASIASAALNLQVSVLITGGAQTFTTTQATITSSNVGGGCATALVALVGGTDYVQGQLTVQGATGTPHTDVSVPGRYPTIEAIFYSQ